MKSLAAKYIYSVCYICEKEIKVLQMPIFMGNRLNFPPRHPYGICGDCHNKIFQFKIDTMKFRIAETNKRIDEELNKILAEMR